MRSFHVEVSKWNRKQVCEVLGCRLLQWHRVVCFCSGVKGVLVHGISASRSKHWQSISPVTQENEQAKCACESSVGSGMNSKLTQISKRRLLPLWSLLLKSELTRQRSRRKKIKQHYSEWVSLNKGRILIRAMFQIMGGNHRSLYG